MKEHLGPAYELIEVYNKLSDEDKRKFQMLFNRTIELERREIREKAFEEMQKITHEDDSAYFNVEYLLKHVIGLSDDDIKDNENFHGKNV